MNPSSVGRSKPCKIRVIPSRVMHIWNEGDSASRGAFERLSNIGNKTKRGTERGLRVLKVSTDRGGGRGKGEERV